MQNITFPISLQFKISSISNDFTATDSKGKIIAYVKQKLFKLKEDILIFSDQSKTEQLYRIKADKWLDFSAAYAFFDKDGKEFGKIARKGWKSIWKAQYTILDENQNIQYTVSEENAWAKVGDSILGQIPIISMLTGYLFNPSYIVKNTKDKEIVRLRKLPSFFGRNFEITKEGPMDSDDDDRILLGLMMMILLEKNRG